MTPMLPLREADEVAEGLAGGCAPLTGGVVEVEAAETLARMFKALGDPTRVRLLSLIAAQPGGEACICDLTASVGLSQPTLSHHMKQLVAAGLVTREPRGKWAFYQVVDTTLSLLSDALRPDPAEGAFGTELCGPLESDG